jgi:hypothetical protein
MEEKKKREGEEKGHNHPFDEKCGSNCPRNEHYKGPAKNSNFLLRGKR